MQKRDSKCSFKYVYSIRRETIGVIECHHCDSMFNLRKIVPNRSDEYINVETVPPYCPFCGKKF